MKETMKQAGYRYISYGRATKTHTLQNIKTGKYEAWIANKNHASYGIIYKNTHLEFCFSR